MIKAFIFDIDGTLIDSNDYHAQAWEKALALHGKKISFRQIRRHIGKGADQLLPEFLTKEEIGEFGKQIAEERGDIFKKEFFNQIRPFAQVRKLFQSIRDADARIALASSGKAAEVEEFKIVAQITDLVEKSTSSDDAEKSKPQPDIFHAAMDLLKHPDPQNVLVVGDTPYDAMAAAKAGLKVIGVLCGGFPESLLRANGCREIYRDPAEMLSKIDHILSL